jgi:flagellar basal-body rod modification protein FlgD
MEITPMSAREFSLNPREKVETDRLALEHNARLSAELGRSPKQELGKDDFLKLLLTQLSYQDPTAPMEDKEFIAQMAQFSSLEQIRQMTSEFSRLADMLSGSEAATALGKTVDIVEGERLIQGTVNAVTRGGPAQILVNGSLYPWEGVTRIYEEQR